MLHVWIIFPQNNLFSTFWCLTTFKCLYIGSQFAKVTTVMTNKTLVDVKKTNSIFILTNAEEATWIMTKRQFSPLCLDILCLNASLFAMVPLCRSLWRLCTPEAEFMVPEMCPSAYGERNFHPLQTCFQNPDCIEVMHLTSVDWLTSGRCL